MATCVRKALKQALFQESNIRAREDWFNRKFSDVQPKHIPFYASFDLRDADFKIAPVDANLFPAGFNNICSTDLGNGAPLMENTLKRILAKLPSRVMIVPEAHTRNRFYVDNLMELKGLLERAKVEVRVTWPTLDVPPPLQGSMGKTLEVFGQDSGFKADLILLNNDFSDGLPEWIKTIGASTPILPNPNLGWHMRRKHTFFHHYNLLVEEFSKALNLDPWALTIHSERVEKINFQTDEGMDELVTKTQHMLESLAQEYAARSIKQDPFVFIKNNAGTYGIGVMRVHRAEELKSLNRRDRNKMSVGKGNQPIHDVIVQEGVATQFQVMGAPAEPVVYLTGTELLGGFLRLNAQRGADDNLNSKGMAFEKLCMSDLRDASLSPDRDLELELVYGTIARISALALCREQQELR